MAGPQLANSHVAHAELNALALLPPNRHYEDHTLLTTLEPCCMCSGAAVQATIMSLRYAGRDPYAGTAHIEVDTPQARRRPISMLGPLPDVHGRFAELLHVIWLLERGKDPETAEHQQAHEAAQEGWGRPSLECRDCHYVPEPVQGPGHGDRGAYGQHPAEVGTIARMRASKRNTAEASRAGRDGRPICAATSVPTSAPPPKAAMRPPYPPAPA